MGTMTFISCIQKYRLPYKIGGDKIITALFYVVNYILWYRIKHSRNEIL